MFIILLFLVHLYRTEQQEREFNRYRVQAINEISSLLNLRAPLPPMAGWAATPELAITVLKTIQAEKPDFIVELGSGVTSVISAYTAENFSQNSTILSFDHNQNFSEQTRKEIELHGLSSFIKIIHAPLTARKIDGQEWMWYDMNEKLLKSNIDLLIIDGPPVKTQKNARYPALPILHPYLSDHAVIILHDSDRQTETETLNKWTEQFDDISIKVNLFSEKGITILQKG